MPALNQSAFKALKIMTESAYEAFLRSPQKQTLEDVQRFAGVQFAYFQARLAASDGPYDAGAAERRAVPISIVETLETATADSPEKLACAFDALITVLYDHPNGRYGNAMQVARQRFGSGDFISLKPAQAALGLPFQDEDWDRPERYRA